MSTRSWICFSSSSGQTFRTLYSALPQEARSQLKAFFVDRECGALAVGQQELGLHRTHALPRKEFEAEFLKWLAANPVSNGMILLCGFFGILSEDFLSRCGMPVVNTHPSLLPAFPGKDEKVHAQAFESVTISGFSVHLVNESLDGGPMVFQHPVFLDPAWHSVRTREEIRSGEQKWLPRVWQRLLGSGIQAVDRNLTTRALREKYTLNMRSFHESDYLITEKT